MDSLEGLQDLVTWFEFVGMDREAFLETQEQAHLELGAATKGEYEEEEEKEEAQTKTKQEQKYPKKTQPSKL